MSAPCDTMQLSQGSVRLVEDNTAYEATGDQQYIEIVIPQHQWFYGLRQDGTIRLDRATAQALRASLDMAIETARHRELFLKTLVDHG